MAGLRGLLTQWSCQSPFFGLHCSLLLLVIEHDSSLSRNDVFFGDNNNFNPAIFDTVAAHFTEETISIETAAKARTDRIAAARSVNPEFNFTENENQFSLFESALYLRTFGCGTEGKARRDWVEIMFRESFCAPVVGEVCFHKLMLPRRGTATLRGGVQEIRRRAYQ